MPMRKKVGSNELRDCPSPVEVTRTAPPSKLASAAAKLGLVSCARAVLRRMKLTLDGAIEPGPPALSITSAATAAACGEAALVPKKFGKLSASSAESLKKNVVLTPSGAPM